MNYGRMREAVMVKNVIVFCLMLLFSGCFPGDAGGQSGIPGHISGREAIRAAEKAFVEKFGERVLRQKPWKAVKTGDRYHVHGTLPRGKVGGTAEAYVSAMNGEVIEVWHSK